MRNLADVVRGGPTGERAQERVAEPVPLLVGAHANHLQAQRGLGPAELAGEASREHVAAERAPPVHRELHVEAGIRERGREAPLDVAATRSAQDRRVNRHHRVQIGGREPPRCQGVPALVRRCNHVVSSRRARRRRAKLALLRALSGVGGGEQAIAGPRGAAAVGWPRREGRHPRRPRDLRERPGRVDVRRPALRLRPPHRVQPALRLVRHAAGLPRRHPHGPRRGARARARARHAARRADRRRAAAPARRLPPDARALRRRAHRARRDERRGGRVRRRPPRPQDHGPQGARARGECAPEPLEQPRPPRRRGDEIKFVLADRADYEWMRATVREQRARRARRRRCSRRTVWGKLAPRDLVAWVLEDALPVRVQVQLHKVIWGAEAQGV